MISFGRTANQISHGLSFDANAQHLSTSRPHVITLARRGGTLELDFSHSSEKNLPKKISPQLKLDFGIPNLFMTLFFALSSYPKNRRDSFAHGALPTQKISCPCYLCWYTQSWMVKLTLNLHLSDIQHLTKWMVSKSSEPQLMKEIRLTCSWVACSHDLEGFLYIQGG